MGTVRTASRKAHVQSARGKLARSGTPDAKSAISRGAAAAGGAAAGADEDDRTEATRVAEPTRAVR